MMPGIIVNHPYVSRRIAYLYASTLGIVIAATLYMAFFAPLQGRLVAIAVMALVSVVISFILRGIYGTRYVIADGELVIRASRLIGGTKRIKLSSITSVRRVSIPRLGLRLFGASFHGGYYYLPGIGRVFMVITNFSDGVLVECIDGSRYVITPRDPDGFVESLMSLARASA